MRLLFDQNLSRHLRALLSDLYSGSLQVREIGLADAPDTVIWAYAIEHGLVIVTKDVDYYGLSAARGHPPRWSGYGLATAQPPKWQAGFVSGAVNCWFFIVTMRRDYWNCPETPGGAAPALLTNVLFCIIICNINSDVYKPRPISNQPTFQNR